MAERFVRALIDFVISSSLMRPLAIDCAATLPLRMRGWALYSDCCCHFEEGPVLMFPLAHDEFLHLALETLFQTYAARVDRGTTVGGALAAGAPASGVWLEDPQESSAAAALSLPPLRTDRLQDGPRCQLRRSVAFSGDPPPSHTDVPPRENWTAAQRLGQFGPPSSSSPRSRPKTGRPSQVGFSFSLAC